MDEISQFPREAKALFVVSLTCAILIGLLFGIRLFNRIYFKSTPDINDWGIGLTAVVGLASIASLTESSYYQASSGPYSTNKLNRPVRIYGVFTIAEFALLFLIFFECADQTTKCDFVVSGSYLRPTQLWVAIVAYSFVLDMATAGLPILWLKSLHLKGLRTLFQIGFVVIGFTTVGILALFLPPYHRHNDCYFSSLDPYLRNSNRSSVL
ncbi:predicted protein [Uncinocarpus reesii 1704]|uniref:Integral membrane protein n=1 Tax=Uncinocarpus reesii (strain UAMH 1704) TaxID=336963 RepID=C4JZ66_UNCRE|nr:uncharacterized protein UREG_07467 [Uncinocarpus reesii 1704]EEP82602.1 predicted protein [Uncinocarpus reesii 1704]